MTTEKLEAEAGLGSATEGAALRSASQQQEPKPTHPTSYLLSELLRIAKNSDCDKLKFGAAALDCDGNVLAFGWNHNPFPSSGYSCARDCVGGIRQGVRSGTCVERCYAIHAEQHAILVASQPIYEIAVAGLRPDGTLFDNGGGFYCTVCARIMIAAGVEVVSIWMGGKRKQLGMTEVWEQSYGSAVEP